MNRSHKLICMAGLVFLGAVCGLDASRFHVSISLPIVAIIGGILLVGLALTFRVWKVTRPILSSLWLYLVGTVATLGWQSLLQLTPTVRLPILLVFTIAMAAGYAFWSNVPTRQYERFSMTDPA